jgi:hypothetical protein
MREESLLGLPPQKALEQLIRGYGARRLGTPLLKTRGGSTLFSSHSEFRAMVSSHRMSLRTEEDDENHDLATRSEGAAQGACH